MTLAYDATYRHRLPEAFPGERRSTATWRHAPCIVKRVLRTRIGSLETDAVALRRPARCGLKHDEEVLDV
jgi:hypothetical protein